MSWDEATMFWPCTTALESMMNICLFKTKKCPEKRFGLQVTGWQRIKHYVSIHFKTSHKMCLFFFFFLCLCVNKHIHKLILLLHSCNSVPNCKKRVVNKKKEDNSSYIPCMHVFLVLLSFFFFFQVINKMAIFVNSCCFYLI